MSGAAPAAGSGCVRDLLRAATARLAAAAVGDSPRLDAEVLLAHALGWPRSRLAAWPERVPDAAAAARFADLLAARLAGTPVAHLTGTREFWSLPLAVSADTLVPRPESELLVELALQRLPPDAAGWVADLGTGSGAIALALASERPRLRLLATDRSAAALRVARANAVRLGLGNVAFAQADWCAPLAPGRLRMLLSNPPYVASGDPHLQRGDLRHEPRSALAAGADGLADLRRLAAAAPACLAPGGLLLVEHGHDQAGAVAALFTAAGLVAVAGCRDLAGLPRVTVGRRPG